MSADHHEDLIRAAREILAQHPARYGGLSQTLSINDAAGTVSDRATGELLGYISPAWTSLTAEELLGWHTWPVEIPTHGAR